MAEEQTDPGRVVRFGPERILLFPVLVFFVGSLPLAASVPWLAWLVLLPLAGGVWVWRAGVRADGRGVTVCNGLRRRHWAWEDVTGFDVPRRGPVRLVAGATRVPLTALGRDELREVLSVAGPH